MIKKNRTMYLMASDDVQPIKKTDPTLNDALRADIHKLQKAELKFMKNLPDPIKPDEKITNDIYRKEDGFKPKVDDISKPKNVKPIKITEWERLHEKSPGRYEE